MIPAWIIILAVGLINQFGSDVILGPMGMPSEPGMLDCEVLEYSQREQSLTIRIPHSFVYSPISVRLTFTVDIPDGTVPIPRTKAKFVSSRDGTLIRVDLRGKDGKIASAWVAAKGPVKIVISSEGKNFSFGAPDRGAPGRDKTSGWPVP